MRTHARFTCRLGVGIATLWFGSAFGADCIYPTAEVVNGVVLRAGASTASARRGLLRPAESLPLVRIAAGWYETRASNGQSAFVSKRWSDIAACDVSPAVAVATDFPAPLLFAGHAVDWWFVFKLNAATFPRCDGSEHRTCPFGGTVQSYTGGQQFVSASSEDTRLKKGGGCLGTTLEDPVGATFDEAYSGHFHYVVWNDQFKGDPTVTGCGEDCASPWGHSKGMAAWNDSGDGFVLQVTTPSWPGIRNIRGSRMAIRSGVRLATM
jgi:hypothetical protein